jgi:hypothetical protein
VQGGNRQEYVNISRIANAAMDKIGQIHRTVKWLRSQSKMPLQAGKLPAAIIFLRYLCHFTASNAYLIGPDPSSAAIFGTDERDQP